MCRSRSHIHKPCGCTTSHIYICPSFPIQPPPQTLKATHRRYTTDTISNPLYTPRHLFLCRKSFYAFPDIQDPAPCRSHRVLERDVRLVMGPPRAPDGAWDEFDGFGFRRRVRALQSRDKGRGFYHDSAAGSDRGCITQQIIGGSIPCSVTTRKSTMQISSTAKKRKDNTAVKYRQKQQRQLSRARHLRVVPKEGYESFPIMDMSRERDIEKCEFMSEDETGDYDIKGILSRVLSLAISGRRGSSVV